MEPNNNDDDIFLCPANSVQPIEDNNTMGPNNNDDDIYKPKYDYRNISVVSVVPMNCGMFKYNEMVPCDKNLHSGEFLDYMYYQKRLQTRPVGMYHMNSDVSNIVTIWRCDTFLNTCDMRTGTSAKCCDKPGLLLKANTTLFELVTIPSIDQFYPKNDDSYMDRLIIDYKFSNGRQGMRPIDELLLSDGDNEIDTTVFITDDKFITIAHVNLVVKIKRHVNLIEITTSSITHKNECAEVVGREYSTIKKMLEDYDYENHRFYMIIGPQVDGVRNLIELHGLVVNSQSMHELNPTSISGELFKHYTDERTQAPKELAKLLKEFAKIIITWNGTFTARHIDILFEPQLWELVHNYTVDDSKRSKYTISYSLQQLIAYMKKQMQHVISRPISDGVVCQFIEENNVGGKKMRCYPNDDDTKFSEVDIYDDTHTFLRY